MDWEAPADAWYVWLGVSIISLAMAGFVLGLPTGPPPDANQAANTIERTTGSTYQASSTVEHDADAIKVDGKTIELRNEHGTDRSSIRYGEVVAVNGEDRLEDLVYGEAFESVYEDELEDKGTNAATVFMNDVARAEENTSGEWLIASDELTVRQVAVEPDELPRLRVRGIDYEYSARRGLRSPPNELSIDPRGVDEPTTVTYTVTGAAPDDVSARGSAYPVRGYEAEWTVTHRDSDIERSDLESHVANREWLERNRQRADDLDLPDGDLWAGTYPLNVTAEFDSQTCETTLLTRADAEFICPTVTATDERAAELDWIERNDETEAYHVTLVVV